MSVRTANDLILRALYLISEYQYNEIPPGYELDEGLYCLNELIDNLSGNSIYIPYFGNDTFNTIQNVDTYQQSSFTWAAIDFIYLTINGITYPLKELSERDYNNNSRDTTLTGTPNSFILRRSTSTTPISSIILYPIPDLVYPCTVTGKKSLLNLTLFTDISSIPASYHRFLRYALARELSSIYGNPGWTSKDEDEYTRMLNQIMLTSDFNLNMEFSNIMSHGGNYNQETDTVVS
jgi:hypothetical protein